MSLIFFYASFFETLGDFSVMTEKNLLRESNKTTPYVGKEPQRRRRSGFFDDDDDDDARRTMTRPTSSSSSAAEKVRVVFLYDDDDFCAFFSTSGCFPSFSLLWTNATLVRLLSLFLSLERRRRLRRVMER